MLQDLLTDLATDPRRLEALKRNPDGLANGINLSSVEQDAIRSGDLQELRALLEADIARHDRRSFERAYEATEYGLISGSPLDATSSWKFVEPTSPLQVGGLVIVGTGIRAGLQTTSEAQICIETAAKVLYLVGDPVAASWLKTLRPDAESLGPLYEAGKRRIEIYQAIVERILSVLRSAEDLCVVFYGHPGVLVYPASEAIRRARLEGYGARMLPAISAEANLFADLGVDPGTAGHQSYDATSFLINQYKFDTRAALVLWQISALGERRWDPNHCARPDRWRVLVDYLAEHYGRDHEVIVYQAAELPVGRAKAQKLSLEHRPFSWNSRRV